MIKIKLFNFPLALALVLTMAIGHAENPPSVTQILERYTRALGGEALARGITSIRTEGTFYFVNGSARGIMRQVLKAPNKSVYTIRSQDGEIFMELGFDGQTGWQQRLYSGGASEVRQITGQALAQMRLNAGFYREFKLSQLYPQLRYRGRAEIAGKLADVIEAVPANSRGERNEIWYFDLETGLLRRRDTWSVSAERSEPVQNYFADYRKVLGVMVPYEMRAYFPDGPDSSIVMILDRVTANVPLQDSQFIMPRWWACDAELREHGFHGSDGFSPIFFLRSVFP